MSTIHVVVDSTAHIRPALLSSHPNLHVVPLKVILGDREWQEPELTNEELFRLTAGASSHPRTSQPAPGDFLTILQPLTGQGCEVIVITLSGGLSGTVRSAGTAAQMLNSPNVYIVDSGTAAIGMEKLVEAAFRLAGEGRAAGEIARRLAEISAATYTMFVPGTLEYLHKGGRIGGAAALLGTLLQIKPILFLTGGKVSVLDKVRTRGRAIARMAEELTRYGRPAYIGVVHLAAEQEAKQLAARLREQYPDVPVSVTGTGSVLGAHLGPGVVGLIFQEVCDT